MQSSPLNANSCPDEKNSASITPWIATAARSLHTLAKSAPSHLLVTAATGPLDHALPPATNLCRLRLAVCDGSGRGGLRCTSFDLKTGPHGKNNADTILKKLPTTRSGVSFSDYVSHYPLQLALFLRPWRDAGSRCQLSDKCEWTSVERLYTVAREDMRRLFTTRACPYTAAATTGLLGKSDS